MARREEIRVSLFPFMSVLACTIGALTLLLASLSLSAVTPRDAPRADGDGAAARGGPRAPTAASPAGPVAPPVPSANPAPTPDRDGLAAAQQLEALWGEVDESLAARGMPTGLSLEDLENRLASARQSKRLASDLAELLAAERALATERDRVETSIAVLESRRETLPILIDPTGLSRHLEPWFVECDARGITAYRASDGYAHFVPRDELGPSDDYGRYLRRLRAIPGALLVLLVRPDGLATTDLAARLAHEAGVRVARLPLPGKGELDWALLQRAEEPKSR
jgi:hypothetical protein